MAGHPVGAAAQPVGFVDDDEVPTSGDEILEPFAVVAGDPLGVPAPAGVHGLDRIQGANHLIVEPPEVVLVVDAGEFAPSGEVPGNDRPEILVEVGAHFGDPLRHETRGRNDEDALNQTAQLQLPQDQSGFDSLAESHLIGQQIPHAIPRHRPRERVDLMRQGNDGTLEGRDQGVALQGVGHPRGGSDVRHAVRREQGRFADRPEIRDGDPHRGVLVREPGKRGRLPPEVGRRGDLDGSSQGWRVAPLARDGLHA